MFKAQTEKRVAVFFANGLEECEALVLTDLLELLRKFQLLRIQPNFMVKLKPIPTRISLLDSCFACFLSQWRPI